MGLFSSGKDSDARRAAQTYAGGRWQDPPEDRPTKRASDSIGRIQKYGPTGKKQ